MTVICSSADRKYSEDDSKRYKVVRIVTRNRVIYETTARWSILAHCLRSQAILVNGLEMQAYSVLKTSRIPYIIKIVGDTVWETARNQGLSNLNIDDFQSNEQSQQKWRAQIEKRNSYVRAASKVITPSNYMRNMVIGWGIPKENVIVIKNSVEVDTIREQSIVARQQSEPLKILYVGRLTNWKGVETLILAASELRNVQITILGDGPAFPSLFELTKQLGLSHKVNFAGRTGAQETRRMMLEHHILVLTSLYEGLSHTILEAFAAGLPCIVSNCGGNGEVVQDGVNGLLISPQNVDELKTAIVRLRDNDDLRVTLASRALRRAGDFDLQCAMESYRKVLSV